MATEQTVDVCVCREAAIIVKIQRLLEPLDYESKQQILYYLARLYEEKAATTPAPIPFCGVCGEAMQVTPKGAYCLLCNRRFER